jgi:hypothetical protein
MTTQTPQELKKPVLYKPGSTSIACVLTKDESGQFVTGWQGLSVADLQNQGYEIRELDDVIPQIEEAAQKRFCKPWKEISEEAFFDALGELPPRYWKGDPNREMFILPERTCITIYPHFARVEDRYFAAQRESGTPFADLYAEIADTFGIDTSAKKED